MPEDLSGREGVAHNNSTYTTRGCRCDVCKADHAWYQAEATIKRRDRLDDLPYEAHGTLSTYNNWACRCDRCKAAAAVSAYDRKLSKQLAHEMSLTPAIEADQPQSEIVCNLGFTHEVHA